MTAYSVLIPFVPRRPEQVLPYAALVQWTGARRLWQGQSLVLEPHQTFAHVAGAGFRVPVGLGVTLMPLRHPYEAALQARSLAMLTGQPVVAGYGPGGTSLQRSLLGSPYRSPLTAAREYLGVVRGLLTGASEEEVAAAGGEYFSCHGRLAPYPAPQVELGLGVLRPGMARVAGELADVAITWLASADYLAEQIMPALREGAATAGRPVPRVAAMVPLALTRPDREPAELALASNAAHLQAPHYQDMLRRSGIEARDEEPLARAKALVDGDAFLSGDLDALTEKLARYERAGVDEVVLNLTGVANLFGPQAAMAELKTLLAALGVS
ncbi:5,10-methylene tetrahydromethanopterin reductase [Streptomyces agglomeratus]|uniref:LLM class flavin-dependent oxidoreductase n=1 Tax=Streptomyces agglomeratus TaxID=285458 RepID=UPI00085410E6|nr:LLM class flavin-dependent oxidoreductase [Streptomyces agglomeratus]OEJ39803.1 5,10-methylene tetrahydromethanopterin reductase [Streptomyces agglomeratus]OEJ45818.1 5,10-methylene tetrahydromethanopterin reductase [Streptomyces agglomeratus]OEJ59725.1 5,10-methylene tetrahydromethanopterin reductase [Streptomyces agglomeratus]